MYEYAGNYSYFAQKREQEMAVAVAETVAEPGQPPGAAGLAESKKGGKSREQRRLEAEDRNRRSKLKMEIGRELPGLEEEISALERLKTLNQSLLCDPDVLKDSARIKPLMQELNQASRRLAELYHRWEDLTRQLEKVDEMIFS
jgi:ATP-binding cassette subfamily F protein 3